ncbi:unnamed protein product [Peniophora sp. CBMAI 1063]|nr:unnamed protein product [Peniophora sp. CBMAI 1063]
MRGGLVQIISQRLEAKIHEDIPSTSGHIVHNFLREWHAIDIYTLEFYSPGHRPSSYWPTIMLLRLQRPVPSRECYVHAPQRGWRVLGALGVIVGPVLDDSRILRLKADRRKQDGAQTSSLINDAAGNSRANEYKGVYDNTTAHKSNSLIMDPLPILPNTDIFIVPEMLLGSAAQEALDQDEDQADDIDARAREVRQEILRILHERRTPFAQLEPERVIKGEGPTFELPLLHFGVALSMQDVRNYANAFECAPEPDPDTPPEYMLPNDAYMELESVQMETRDLLLQRLQETCGVPNLKSVECLNTHDKIWVLTTYSNLNFGAGSTVQEEVIAFERVIEKLDAIGAWYWDYELCGIRYSSPWDTYNIWPAHEIARTGWPRSFWVLEKNTENTERKRLLTLYDHSEHKLDEIADDTMQV